jgi:hypothetical protein
MRSPRKDLTDLRFGLLTAISIGERSAAGKIRWLCKCDCGGECLAQTSNLTNQHTQSCGCQKYSGLAANCTTANLKHGRSGTGEYSSWQAMIKRCTNPSATEYKYYGARGVSVCARWMDFANFFADMGERPKNKTLDRIDVNGNYEPSNCRWATHKEQGRNKRNNRVINGFVLAELAEITGINRSTITGRIRRANEALQLKVA